MSIMKRKLKLVCALLFLALLVLQFTPYWSWTTEEGEQSCSIAQLIWFPERAAALKEQLQIEAKGFSLQNAIVQMPLVVSICSIVGLLMCLASKRRVMTDILCIVFGFVSVLAYMSDAKLFMGDLVWLHVLVAGAIRTLGVLSLADAWMQKDAA